MPDNTKVTANISDLHQPASTQMNRRNLLIKFTFFCKPRILSRCN